jgi:phosphoribosylcarboxyaminoimidazole (NCAIR) mutase
MSITVMEIQSVEYLAAVQDKPLAHNGSSSEKLNLLNSLLQIIQTPLGINVGRVQVTVAQDVCQRDQVVVILLEVVIGESVPENMRRYF